MRRSSWPFITLVLVLTIGLVQMNHVFHEYYSDSKDLKEELSVRQAQIEREKLKWAMLNNQLEDFRTSVAQVIPNYQKNANYEQRYALGKLTASIRNPASVEPVDLSNQLMAKGKEQFSKQEFAKATVSFKQAIERFPASANTLEGQFLLAESYFLSSQLDPCLDVIHLMMVQYPDQEMTGYIMLRMGLIFQSRKQNAEAMEVYKTVISNFKSSNGLVNQAHRLMKSLET
jgi:TolA-binding protein